MLYPSPGSPPNFSPRVSALRSRPRAVTLVNIEKQQPLDMGEEKFPPSPTVAYRDADYDTDPGVAITKRRVDVGSVDMQRSRGGDAVDASRRGYFSDGERKDAGAVHVARDGEEC